MHIHVESAPLTFDFRSNILKFEELVNLNVTPVRNSDLATSLIQDNIRIGILEQDRDLIKRSRHHILLNSSILNFLILKSG